MELYYIIAITDHDRGEAMGSLYHAAGLHLILSMPARGTATSEHLAIYGLDATEKCVIAAVGSAQEAERMQISPGNIRSMVISRPSSERI